MVKKFITRITSIGCKVQFTELDNKFIILSNILNLVLSLAMLLWILLALIYYPAFNSNLIVFLFTFLACAISFVGNYKGNYLFSKVFLLAAYAIAMAVHVFLLGTSYGHQFLFIPSTVIAFFLFKKNEHYYKYFLFLLSVVAFLFFELFFRNERAIVTLGPPEADAMRIAIAITIFGSITLLALYTSFQTTRVEESLDSERKRSGDLLLNILPESVASRLMANPNNIVDSFANVSILFADIEGFTNYATKISPEELVSFLNDLFTKFDELAHRYGLEKIKTIGDCYMVASGVPVENADHANLITCFALDVLQLMGNINKGKDLPLSIRIGISSGPVVAGVIGTKKFIYDIWGDTVNMASRMESHGIAGQIQINSSTYELIQDDFEITRRGEIDVKGKGTTTTFIVKGRKQTVI